MTAHGLPLKIANIKDYDVSKAQDLNEKGVSQEVEDNLLALSKQHLLSQWDQKEDVSVKAQHPSLGPGSLTAARPIKVVWLRTGKATADGTPAALTYHVEAVATDPFAMFDIFIDITTMEVEMFVDNTKRVSPFVSPIETEIKVYDMYLKDYNDDQDDNNAYSGPDPDRMSEATKVFDTTGSDTFPTTNKEMNDLVDYTMYVSNLYNSLSNGQLSTWNSALPFNIEFNLTISNAYFDGDWGIHFGTGYITDDVVVSDR